MLPFVLFLLQVGGTVGVTECPNSTWVKNTTVHMCLIHRPYGVTFQEGKEICEQAGATLPLAKDSVILQAYIADKEINTFGGYKDFWLGMKLRQDARETKKWLDGEIMTWSHFASFSFDRNEALCAGIIRNGPSIGEWLSFRCWWKISVSCQILLDCPNHTYGPRCQFNCTAHCAGKCSRTSGLCLGDCEPGYYLPTCQACPTSHFGRNCSHVCDKCPANSTNEKIPLCDHVTGECLIKKAEDDDNWGIEDVAIIKKIAVAIALFSLIALGLLLLFCCRRRKKKEKKEKQEEEVVMKNEKGEEPGPESAANASSGNDDSESSGSTSSTSSSF